MTKNYIKPEVEIIAVHLEGAVLSGSFGSSASGSNVTLENESDFDSFFNN